VSPGGSKRLVDQAFTVLHDRGLAELWKLGVRWSGADVGRSVRVLGRPIVTVAPESSIVLGDRSVLISRARATALGVARPVILRTLASGASIVVGSDVGMSGSTICAARSISIGDRVLLGADVVVADTDFHDVAVTERRYATPPESRPEDAIVIEDDVFVGARTLVLKGSTIGSGSVIGAGSLVAGTIPPGVVAAGNPCRVIRSLAAAPAG